MKCSNVDCKKEIAENEPHYNFPNRGEYCYDCGDLIEIPDEEIYEAIESKRIQTAAEIYGPLLGDFWGIKE
jgi:hypothetical protein